MTVGRAHLSGVQSCVSHPNLSWLRGKGLSLAPPALPGFKSQCSDTRLPVVTPPRGPAAWS